MRNNSLKKIIQKSVLKINSNQRIFRPAKEWRESADNTRIRDRERGIGLQK
jgi:hypothetical protein